MNGTRKRNSEWYNPGSEKLFADISCSINYDQTAIHKTTEFRFKERDWRGRLTDKLRKSEWNRYTSITMGHGGMNGIGRIKWREGRIRETMEGTCVGTAKIEVFWGVVWKPNNVLVS